MKSKLLIIIFSIFPICFFSQNLKIDYKIGGYAFGKNGEYERQEIVKIYPEKRNLRMDFIQLKKT